MHGVVLVHRHRDRVGVANCIGNAPARLLQPAPQALLLHHVYLMAGQLRLYLLPAEQFPHSSARRFQSIARGDRQHYRVAMDAAAALRPGVFVEEPLGDRAWLTGVGNRVRSQHRVPEAAVVTHVARGRRQPVDAHVPAP